MLVTRLVGLDAGLRRVAQPAGRRAQRRQDLRRAAAGQVPARLRDASTTSRQLLVPPTSEREPVTQALDALQAEGGTAIGSGLEAALTGLQPVIQRERAEAREEAQREGRRARRGSPPAVVVLLSDGYSTTGTEPA